MTVRLVSLAILGLGLGALPAAALSPATGPAGPAVDAYLGRTAIECYRSEGESRCPIREVASGTRMAYGTMSGVPTAVAFVDYQYDLTGNAMNMMAVVFRQVSGTWTSVGRAEDIRGTDPRRVRFDGDAVTYVGTVMGAGDSRSNPTGRKEFRLTVRDGKVTFAYPGR